MPRQCCGCCKFFRDAAEAAGALANMANGMDLNKKKKKGKDKKGKDKKTKNLLPKKNHLQKRQKRKERRNVKIILNYVYLIQFLPLKTYCFYGYNLILKILLN